MSDIVNDVDSAVQILTDEVELNPFLDFDRYSNTILRIIRGSTSNFVIGIYGEWGTGKTTLMKSIYNQLNENDINKSIIPVWFNAWKFEEEEYLH